MLPGPSVVPVALVASGLPTDRWRFEGFLPRRAGEMERVLRSAETVVAFESPRRVGESLAALASLAPDRPAAVCRELTKMHEEVARGTLGELARRFRGDVKGEIVLVIGPAADARARQRRRLRRRRPAPPGPVRRPAARRRQRRRRAHRRPAPTTSTRASRAGSRGASQPQGCASSRQSRWSSGRWSASASRSSDSRSCRAGGRPRSRGCRRRPWTGRPACRRSPGSPTSASVFRSPA